MRTRHARPTFTLPCLLAAFTVGAAPAVAQTTADADPNRTPEREVGSVAEEASLLAGTQYRHVAGSAFVPLYGDAGVTYGSRGCTYFTNSVHAFSHYSLDLPNGSIVTAVSLYFNDTAVSDGTLYLTRYSDGVAHAYLATVATSGSAGLGSTTASGLEIQLDNVDYNYVMYWLAGVSGSTLQLCGFRVTYLEPTLFADGFESGNVLAWDLAVP